MKIIRNIGIALLCCVVLVSGQGVINDDDDVTTTTPAATTTVSTKATTTTTEAPPPPDTTTTPTTTPRPSPPETTTPQPAPVPPVTTPAPTPTPDYPRNTGKWSVEDKDNVTCIALKGAMQIVVLNHENKTVNVNIPSTAVATGSCSDPQNITLTWDSVVADKENTLTLSLELNNATKGALAVADSGITNGKFGLQNVTVVLHLNATNSTTGERVKKELTNLATFQTPLKHSYSCLAEEALKSKTGDFSLKIREVQLEAYRLTAPGHREFSTAVQCPADDATDVVPIAVGAALAGLVVIVLIAYLIGRRKSRARGYQSV